MNDNETFADVLAEMRGAKTEFPFVYLIGEPDTPEVVDFKTKKIIEPRKINIRRVTVKELADRIDAAHKRERENYDAKIADLQLRVKLWTDRYDELVNKCVEQYAKLKQVGNSAKLRDALELCVKGMCGFCRMDAEARGMTTECVNGCEALLMAKAALAAPPRNCDVYTADELKVIFKRELASELPIANEHEKNLITITAMRMIDTLFSPATEKEGGNDAN